MMLWGKLIVVNTCVRKEEIAQINNPNFHLKNPEKKSKLNPMKAERRT